jgi:hypothetical protein
MCWPTLLACSVYCTCSGLELADIVAKVPDRWELIFLCLKTPLTTADSCALNRVTEIVSQFIVKR